MPSSSALLRHKSTVGFAVFGVKRRVRRGDEILYKDTLRHVFYGTVTDTVSGSHPDDEIRLCPSCGNEYELITDDWVLVDLKMIT